MKKLKKVLLDFDVSASFPRPKKFVWKAKAYVTFLLTNL